MVQIEKPIPSREGVVSRRELKEPRCDPIPSQSTVVQLAGGVVTDFCRTGVHVTLTVKGRAKVRQEEARNRLGTAPVFTQGSADSQIVS